MKRTFRTVLLLLLALSVVLSAGQSGRLSVTIYGADNTVKIHIGDSTSASHHKAVALNTTSDEFSFELKGYTAKSSKYESSNEDSFRIIKTGDGKCKVDAIKEGTGHVILTVKTTEGDTLVEKVFISVYTRIAERPRGEVMKDASVYMGASKNAGVENYDNKGELAKGTEVDLTAACGEYYIFKTLDGKTFKDGKDTGFIEKKNVKIPVTSVSIEQDIIHLNVGETVKLNARVEPEIAEDKSVTWSSSDTKTATVDSKGNVIAKKMGTAVITVVTKDGNKKAECDVVVGYASKASGKTVVNKETLSIKSDSFTSVILSFALSNDVNGYRVYYAKKKGKWKIFGTVTEKIKKGTNCSYSALGLKKNTKYRFKIKTYTNSKGKKVWSKYSNTVSITTGEPHLYTEVVDNKSIRLIWDKIKGSAKYEVYRAASKNGKYKKIATVKKSKRTYTNKKLKSNKKYYYKVRAVKKSLKGKFSNKVGAKTKKAINDDKNINYFKNNYPFVCTNSKENMNNYKINNIYSAAKYKYSNKVLEIHVYLDFVTYTKTNELIGNKYVYNRAKANKKLGIDGTSYVTLFKQGLKMGYDGIYIGGSKADLDNHSFKTKLVIHEQGSSESYHPYQQFVEVLIGGECPNCPSKVNVDGIHWYHQDYNNNAGDTLVYHNTNIICMPTNAQTQANPGDYYSNKSKTQYKKTSAHEMGHILGLLDAYYDEEVGYDRCADNNETGLEYKKGFYDNMMKCEDVRYYISANDLEMMLEAYKNTSGRPWGAMQAYKSFGNTEISKVIKNNKDYQNDKPEEGK